MTFGCYYPISAHISLTYIGHMFSEAVHAWEFVAFAGAEMLIILLTLANELQALPYNVHNVVKHILCKQICRFVCTITIS